jgi:GNAT superfamily N-acetyltransferase
MIAKRSINSDQGADWRLTTATDLEAIQNIANVVHPDLSERPEIFAEKLRLFPEGCFVLVEDRAVLGYAFVHPWRLNDIPKLDAFLLSLPSDPQCILIHDVAVLPQARGKRSSELLVERISRLAKKQNVRFLALVSVYGSHLHWARLGFKLTSNKALARKLASYGETARYMVCRLG